MTKELEALKTIKNFLGYNYCSVDLPNELKCVEQALQRLEQIDNTEPSEALECLKILEDCADIWGDYSHIVESIEQSLLEFKRLDLLLQLPSEQSSSHFTYKDKNLVCMQSTKYSKLMNAFLELESIKEAKPSEALDGFRGFKNGMITNNAICITKSYFDNKFPIIESALLKAQEQEEILDILKKYAKNDDWSDGGWTIEFWNMKSKEIDKVSKWLTKKDKSE